MLGAGANTVTIGTAPTVGTGGAAVLGTSLTITTAAVGAHISSNPGGAAVGDVATQAGVLLQPALYVTDAGSITITTTATVTGSVKWDLAWIPLDLGASVAAA